MLSNLLFTGSAKTTRQNPNPKSVFCSNSGFVDGSLWHPPKTIIGASKNHAIAFISFFDYLTKTKTYQPDSRFHVRPAPNAFGIQSAKLLTGYPVQIVRPLIRSYVRPTFTPI